MIFLRLREFGSSDWTEVALEGDLEEFAGTLLASCLADNATLHVQKKEVGEEWEDL